jgi:hypothetical protein
MCFLLFQATQIKRPKMEGDIKYKKQKLMKYLPFLNQQIEQNTGDKKERWQRIQKIIMNETV